MSQAKVKNTLILAAKVLGIVAVAYRVPKVRNIVFNGGGK